MQSKEELKDMFMECKSNPKKDCKHCECKNDCDEVLKEILTRM